MAISPVTPVQSTMLIRQGLDAYSKTPAVKLLDGTVVDLSGWNSLIIDFVPVSNDVFKSSLTAAGTALGNSDGTINLTIPGANSDSLGVGTCTGLVKGKVLTGDPFELLATVAVTILPGYPA